MDHHWIDDAIANMPGTSVTYKEEWGAMIYRVADKMIGMRGGYKDRRPLVTIKLPPEQGELLRQTQVNIIPGYYMNKLHYNSIFLDAGVDEALIAELLEDSYDCVFAMLTKKVRQAIER
ncbi:MAG: MmcQ/YjbR family DNA-binding protein [Thermomicrobiales bacterium]|nr:MmcQ/YjbR family DNA-binding protein [Thermomicrobiales bacterium]